MDPFVTTQRMKVEDLRAYALKHNLSVIGTGSKGKITKKDLQLVCNAHSRNVNQEKANRMDRQLHKIQRL